MEEKEISLARAIARLGAASEVELQVETLQPLAQLKSDLSDMERKGLITRRMTKRKGGFGDRLLLTPTGRRLVRTENVS
ncbi:MAG: hypothetical protein JJU00_02735 [Opitutales bacterium]|nr:hypothetical protein [Opitutales bacterium]